MVIAKLQEAFSSMSSLSRTFINLVPLLHILASVKYRLTFLQGSLNLSFETTSVKSKWDHIYILQVP